MRLFKYTERQYAEELMRGKIYIPNVTSYHNVKKLGEAIGDREEGTDRQILSGQFVLGKYGIPLIRGASGARVNIKDSTFVHAFTDLYAFCVSTECSKDLMEKFSKMNEQVGKAPYDTCLEITNIVRFRRRLKRLALAQHKLVYCTDGECVYTRTAGTNAVRNPALEPKHFLEKPLEFMYQREYRFGFVLAMEVNSIEPFYVVESLELGSHFTKVPLA